MNHDLKNKELKRLFPGTRVYCTDEIETTSGFIHKGDEGTVMAVDAPLGAIGVNWDRDVGGHNLLPSSRMNLRCTQGHGWYFFIGDRYPQTLNLEKIEQKPFKDNEDMVDFINSLRGE